MEFFYLDNTKYTPKCPECLGIIEFKINQNDFTISYKCLKGHNDKNIPIKKI